MILQVARTELGTDDVALAQPGTAARRFVRLGVGVADDVDGGRRRAARLPRRARGAGRRRAAGEIDVERVYRHARTTPLDPETGQITAERAHVSFAVAAMRVVAEVDVELGLTRLVWIGTAQDVGKAINPLAVEGQIEGGTAQGLGLALMEEIQTRDGLITNASFTDYLIPTALDMPPVVSELIEDPEPGAPYGVKGVGEPPTVVSTAAVVSALRAATGRELDARARPPGRHRRSLALVERQRSADPEQHHADGARPRERDALDAEPAVAVDRDAHRQLARDQEPDRRRRAEPRRHDRDREHDDDAHAAAADPVPPRRAERVAEAREALAQRRAATVVATSVEKTRFAASASYEPTRSPKRPITATWIEPASPATSASPTAAARCASHDGRSYTLSPPATKEGARA